MSTISGKPFTSSALRLFFALALLVALFQSSARPTVASTRIDIIGPPGSDEFGTSVTALPNGNLVVIDPYFDAGSTQNVGAVYLYNGATGALISALTGSTEGDLVGYGGVKVLTNGNYVVNSYLWNNGATLNVGAVTWGNAFSGVNGVVSPANSLVGSTSDDSIGSSGVFTLTNGNFVVSSPLWNNGATLTAGAVTWGNGAIGISGPVATFNSLVGSQTGDMVGYGGVTALTNGNYVVRSHILEQWRAGRSRCGHLGEWDPPAVSGVVIAANSLVGSTDEDQVGH